MVYELVTTPGWRPRFSLKPSGFSPNECLSTQLSGRKVRAF